MLIDFQPQFLNGGARGGVNRFDRGQNRLASVSQSVQEPMTDLFGRPGDRMLGQGRLDMIRLGVMALGPQLFREQTGTGCRGFLIVAHGLIIR